MFAKRFCQTKGKKNFKAHNFWLEFFLLLSTNKWKWFLWIEKKMFFFFLIYCVKRRKTANESSYLEKRKSVYYEFPVFRFVLPRIRLIEKFWYSVSAVLKAISGMLHRNLNEKSKRGKIRDSFMFEWNEIKIIFQNSNLNFWSWKPFGFIWKRKFIIFPPFLYHITAFSCTSKFWIEFMKQDTHSISLSKVSNKQ